MCLLCEELWMPFDLPPEAKARAFVADSPAAHDAAAKSDRPIAPIPDASSDRGDRDG